MRNSTVIGRVAAVGAVVMAIIAITLVLSSGGSGYQVKAVFANASQIVTGDQVQVAGVAIGSVSKIEIANGQARLTLSIDNPTYQPLREGTIATVRLTSLTGIANRYVDLRLGSGTAPEIPNGGTIADTHTVSAVDLDQLLNSLDAPTRQGLANVIQGSASQYAGEGKAMQAALPYLNPAIVSTSVLFAELNRDTPKFTNFIVKSSGLVTDLGQRAGALSSLVRDLSTTTQALAAQRTQLGTAIHELPSFMRLANTTFVNLRSALDEIKPLVDVANPVAPKLRAFLEQLKPLAEQAVPTVRDLSNVVSSPGPNNDLTDLVKLAPSLAAVAVHDVKANGATRAGAFPQTTIALNDSTPLIATARPYAPDVTGWFEGFSHPGLNTANGSSNRASSINAPVTNYPQAVKDVLNNLASLPLDQQMTQFASIVGQMGITAFQGDRCPGSIERGALWYPESGYPCNPSQVPTGP